MLGSCLHADIKLYCILSCSESLSVCGRGWFGSLMRFMDTALNISAVVLSIREWRKWEHRVTNRSEAPLILDRWSSVVSAYAQLSCLSSFGKWLSWENGEEIYLLVQNSFLQKRPLWVSWICMELFWSTFFSFNCCYCILTKWSWPSAVILFLPLCLCYETFSVSCKLGQ